MEAVCPPSDEPRDNDSNANRVMAVERGRGDKFAKIVRRRLEALTQNHRMETNVLEVMG
jgi:hypothetical protein